MGACVDNSQREWGEKADSKVITGLKRDCKGNSFNAFIRRYGYWKTKDKDYFSWNDRFQLVMSEKLSPGFDKLEEQILNAETSNIAKVKALFQKLETSLAECEDFQGKDGAKAFYDQIHANRDEVTKAFTELFAKLRRSINSMRLGCFLEQTSERPTTYVARALLDTYDAGKEILKSGQRRAQEETWEEGTADRDVAGYSDWRRRSDQLVRCRR